MSVRRRKWRDPKTGRENEVWMVDCQFERPDGTMTPRVRKVSPVQTRRGAEDYERQLRESLLDGSYDQQHKEVLTFEEWFNGRFWEEWVVGRKNKASEVEAKRGIFKQHLGPTFGKLRLDEIDVTAIAKFRASLVKRCAWGREGRPPVSAKRINNVLAVLSKALHYAARVRLIDHVPEIGLFKVERPEIECWDFEQYARVLVAARAQGPEWFAAVCLAGEAGLRVGEVKALRWREDVDLIGRTITVSQQVRHKVTDTPKGRTRRTIAMTPTLVAALEGLGSARSGFVVQSADGTQKTDEQARYALDVVYGKAGLPSDGWHKLRHSLGTHAALFGVNPWRLQAWMGHKRIDETMLYVHVADAHRRPIPPAVLQAAAGIEDPDQRILVMLGARLDASSPAKAPTPGSTAKPAIEVVDGPGALAAARASGTWTAHDGGGVLN